MEDGTGLAAADKIMESKAGRNDVRISAKVKDLTASAEFLCPMARH